MQPFFAALLATDQHIQASAGAPGPESWLAYESLRLTGIACEP